MHDRYGEDGLIQGTLDMLKIPYTGSGVLAAGVEEAFGLPVVIKAASQGSSIGVSIVERAEDLDAAIDNAFSFGDEISRRNTPRAYRRTLSPRNFPTR